MSYDIWKIVKYMLNVHWKYMVHIIWVNKMHHVFYAVNVQNLI